MYLVFTRTPGESYRRRLGSLLYFRALINSLVCWSRVLSSVFEKIALKSDFASIFVPFRLAFVLSMAVHP